MTSTLVAAPGAPYFTPFQDIPAGKALNPQKNGEPIPKLFQPLKIRGVEFQNRVFVSPMAMFGAENGLVTPWLLAHLGGMILRGPGLTFTEGVAVLPEGRTSVQDAGLWSDTHAEAFRPIVDFAHSQGQKIGVQLAHGGRKASTVAVWLKAEPTAPKEVGGWPENVWGSSNRQYAPGFPEPKELSIEGIKNIVRAFADAAKRAVAAGFDVIEVHSAHGFLLSEFLSPSSNNRKDVYGGSFENRIRFTLEVVDAIRAIIPDDMPLLVRVSGTEWLEEVAPDEPQWTKEDTAKLAPILADHGVDLIDVSTGGLNPRQKIRSGPEYQVPFAAAAKESAGSKILVGAVGGLYEGKTANGVVESGRADVVFVGRQFLKNPGHVLQMAEDLGVGIQYAHQLGWPFTGRATQLLGTIKKQ